MKSLVAVHIVQFSLWEYESFKISRGGTAFLGPNGAGKTSLIDAVQIAMVGGHGQHLNFNAQSSHKDSRSIRSYALGTMRSGEGESGVITRKRDEALSYITLVFEDPEKSDEAVSAGICIHATLTESRVLGLYVFPGLALTLDAHLEELPEGGMAPIDWDIFSQNGRQHAKTIGRTPTITAQPETYVSELLHNINQGVDARKFLRAFGHSINLKSVSSIGDFLRGYLVDATPIDKRGTLQHIKTLRELGAEIERVKNKIASLDDITKSFSKVSNIGRKISVSRSTRLELMRESIRDELGQLAEEQEALTHDVEALSESIPLWEIAATEAQERHSALLISLSKDPEISKSADRNLLKVARDSAASKTFRALHEQGLSMREALSQLHPLIQSQSDSLYAALLSDNQQWEKLASAREAATSGQVENTRALLQAGLSLLKKHAADESKELEHLRQELVAAETRFQQAAKGRLVVDDKNLALTIAAFGERSIGCDPVASLVKIRDPSWQGPIETFLGGNRMALLVEPGKEDAAVRIIRERRINDVTVVQPEHLKSDMGRQFVVGTAASLLEGESLVALAFLQRILGKMKCVDSEQQLRMEPRAITKDYMLSANGGTKRLSPIHSDRWMLGARLSGADKAEINRRYQELSREVRETELGFNRLSEAIEIVQTVLRVVTVQSYDSKRSEWMHALNDAVDLDAELRESLSERVLKLQADVKEAKSLSESAQKKANEGRISLNSKTLSLQQIGEKVLLLDDQWVVCNRNLEAAMRDPDWDVDAARATYEKTVDMERAKGANAALEWLAAIEKAGEAALEPAKTTAVDAFREFIIANDISLVEERSDWRKAWSWSTRYIGTLRDSTLVDYIEQAQNAKAAAEQSFQSDVKFKMKEAILRVTTEISDLNRMLDACPAFTNGERYKFIAKVSPAHQGLHDLIVADSNALTTDLFGRPEVQQNLLSLLEASEAGLDKGNNPLEDYRLLFNFDLEIHQNGKCVDLLSKRMGVASNGEHRVPFHVIAGAGLATAYRIRPGKKHHGAGLMILDEAFFGMDAQNTYVTAEFLNALGLQLLMAGPDADIGKLMPVMDNYYDLVRYGPDVFIESVTLKAPVHKLLTSDIPILNPDLLSQEEARIFGQQQSVIG